jgi:hypothetical protein
MGTMKATTAPDPRRARAQRLARVKFVGLPPQPSPLAEAHQAPPARLLARLRDSFIRVIGCLEAARP